MKFNILKTRKGRLTEKLKLELATEKPDIEKILSYIDDYEMDNLATINKFKREKTVELKKINAAVKSCIVAHGPITKLLIGSCSKRIHGALLVNKPKERLYNRIIEKLKIK